MARRFPAILLLLGFAALGSGTMQRLHYLDHELHDAHCRGEQDRPAHDDSNCDLHRQLHLPLIVAVLPPLSLAPQRLAEPPRIAQVLSFEQRIPTRHDCRGPPIG